MPKFKFRNFQKQDLARGACRDGVILSWDFGGGKTIACYAWPIIKQSARTLLVVPEGLWVKFRQDGRDFFNVMPIPIKTVEDFYKWNLHKPAKPLKSGKPKFFITTYEALGRNGADEWNYSDDETVIDDDGSLTNRVANRVTAMGVPPKVAERRHKYYKKCRSSFHGLDFAECMMNIGKERNGFTCVLKPSISTLIAAFDSFDCIAIDEGVAIQGNDSQIAHGVRRTNPRYRLLCTAHPIKNRIESFFWLAQWVAGGSAEPTALWPYESTSEAREAFANEHSQHDRFLTREEIYYEQNNKNRKFEKRSARICNIHRLWKMVAPLVIRRRKKDFGEDIVPFYVKPIQVAMGSEQRRVYEYHLNNPPKHAKDGQELRGRSSIAAQNQFLRQAALCPNSPNLARYITAGRIPASIARNPMTPKLAICLKLVAECLKRNEQIIIGSPFREFSDLVHSHLIDANVKSILLDGRTTAKRRGELAHEFKCRTYSVMVVGQQAMGEGHSFERCPNIIATSLDWAPDINEQLPNRVHRLTSEFPVNFYCLETLGTIDTPISTLHREKVESSDLTLDGVLQEQAKVEVDHEKLLAESFRAFSESHTTIDEADLQQDWEASLKPELEILQRAFL